MANCSYAYCWTAAITVDQSQRHCKLRNGQDKREDKELCAVCAPHRRQNHRIQQHPKVGNTQSPALIMLSRLHWQFLIEQCFMLQAPSKQVRKGFLHWEWERILLPRFDAPVEVLGYQSINGYVWSVWAQDFACVLRWNCVCRSNLDALLQYIADSDLAFDSDPAVEVGTAKPSAGERDAEDLEDSDEAVSLCSICYEILKRRVWSCNYDQWSPSHARGRGTRYWLRHNVSPALQRCDLCSWLVLICIEAPL